MSVRSVLTLVLATGAALAAPALAQDIAAKGVAATKMCEEDLAKQLANPVAALISVPFQLNDDQDIGPAR